MRTAKLQQFFVSVFRSLTSMKHARRVSQPGPVAEAFELHRSVVGANAGFHADRAWRKIGDDHQQLIAPH